MSIFFNTEAISDLLTTIETTRRTLEATHSLLAADAHSASELLSSAGSAQPNALAWSAELDMVDNGLAREYDDLALRVSTLIAADARTAYALSTTTGRTLNSVAATLALNSGYTYDEALLRHELAALRARPRPLTAAETNRVTHLESKLAKIEAPFSIAGTTGDRDFDLTNPRVGTPLRISSSEPAERGRELLIRAIADTANPDQILADEFEAFLHDNGNVTIVLAGVIDLSRPNLGYDERTASLRDLDQQALDSAINPGLAHNGYAQRVSDWTELMIETGVIETGARTAIIGHSFGSDTAFDLAQDEHFNGDLVEVTHVFGAGYELTERLSNVPSATDAVSATNIFDTVAFSESLARHGGTLATGRTRFEVVEGVVNGATSVANKTIRDVEHRLERDGLVEVALPQLPPLELVGDLYSPIEPNVLHITFEGGFSLSSAGHHQDEYEAFLSRANNDSFTTFLDGIDEAGFTSNAVAVSIDVSRPVTPTKRSRQDKTSSSD